MGCTMSVAGTATHFLVIFTVCKRVAGGGAIGAIAPAPNFESSTNNFYVNQAFDV